MTSILSAWLNIRGQISSISLLLTLSSCKESSIAKADTSEIKLSLKSKVCTDGNQSISRMSRIPSPDKLIRVIVSTCCWLTTSSSPSPRCSFTPISNSLEKNFTSCAKVITLHNKSAINTRNFFIEFILFHHLDVSCPQYCSYAVNRK